MSELNYIPENKKKYDSCPVWGICRVDKEKKLLKLNLQGTSIKKDQYFVRKEKDKSWFEIPFDDIQSLRFVQKERKRTTKNSKGEATVTKVDIYFLYGVLKDGSDINCPFAEGSEFLNIRKISELIAQHVQVDIRDETGASHEIRGHAGLDDPWYVKLKTQDKNAFQAPEKKEGFRFEKNFDRWTLHTNSAFLSNKNSFFKDYGCVSLIVFWFIAFILVWTYSDAMGFGWIMEFSFLLCILLFVVRSTVRFKVTRENFIFEERLFGLKRDHVMELRKLEEIKLSAKSKRPINKLLLISDEKMLEYSFSERENARVVLSFLNNAMATLKNEGFKSPFVHSVKPAETDTRGKILKKLFLIPTILLVISFICIGISFISPYDSEVKAIRLKLMNSMQINEMRAVLVDDYQKIKLNFSEQSPKFFGKKKFKFLNNLYLGKAKFLIRYSWGAEGPYVISLQIKNLKTGEIIAKVVDEYYISKWNEESQTTEINELLPCFQPENNGDELEISILVDFASSKDKFDLHQKIREIDVTFTDYGKWNRWSIFFMILCVMSSVMVCTEFASTRSIVLRIIFLIWCYSFLLSSVMATSPVITKEIGPHGTVHFRMRSRYRGGFFRGGGSNSGK